MAEQAAAVPAAAAAPVTPAPGAAVVPAAAAPVAPVAAKAGEPTAVLAGDSLIGGGTAAAAPVVPAAVEITDASKIPGYDKAAADKSLTEKLTAEGKTATEIQAAIKAADDEVIASVKPGAPEAYKDFTVDPSLGMNPEMINEFKTVAKDLNLNQRQAQGLVDLQSKYAKAQGEAVLNQFRQAVESWKQETVLTLGAGYKEELGIAAKAIERFGSPELRQLLNDTGLGNQKDVVLFFNKIGKAISEDGLADGKTKAATITEGQLFYPDMPK